MNRRGFAIAAGAARHLIKFGSTKGHVIQHDVTDVGKVDALSKGTRCNDAANLCIAESFFHAQALGARQTRIVEQNFVAQIWQRVAQHARQKYRLLTGIHIHNGLLARRNDVHQGGVAILCIATIAQLQVCAHRIVDKNVGSVYRKQMANLLRAIGVGRCAKR